MLHIHVLIITIDETNKPSPLHLLCKLQIYEKKNKQNTKTNKTIIVTTRYIVTQRKNLICQNYALFIKI